MIYCVTHVRYADDLAIMIRDEHNEIISQFMQRDQDYTHSRSQNYHLSITLKRLSPLQGEKRVCLKPASLKERSISFSNVVGYV